MAAIALELVFASVNLHLCRGPVTQGCKKLNSSRWSGHTVTARHYAPGNCPTGFYINPEPEKLTQCYAHESCLAHCYRLQHSVTRVIHLEAALHSCNPDPGRLWQVRTLGDRKRSSGLHNSAPDSPHYHHCHSSPYI